VLKLICTAICQAARVTLAPYIAVLANIFFLCFPPNRNNLIHLMYLERGFVITHAVNESPFKACSRAGRKWGGSCDS